MYISAFCVPVTIPKATCVLTHEASYLSYATGIIMDPVLQVRKLWPIQGFIKTQRCLTKRVLDYK